MIESVSVTNHAFSKPMVLHTRIVNGVGGGPEKTILNSPRFLRPLGYESACLYLYPDGDTGIESLKRRAKTSEAELIAWPDGKAIDFEMVERLHQFCRERNVAIWHAHDYKTNVLGLLVRRKWPMKLVTTAHGWCISNLKSWAYACVGRACFMRYDAVVAVSDDLYRSSLRWGLFGKRIRHIPNAIDAEDYQRSMTPGEAREKFDAIGLPAAKVASRFLLVSLGRLSVEKGLPYLLQAVGLLRDRNIPVALWMGGEGPLRSELEKQIEAQNLTCCVKLLGHVADPRILLQCADAFVLSSVTEGLPNVLLEAMSLGVPIVSTSVGGIPRLIEHEKHGLLVDARQPFELSAAIERLQRDSDLRVRLTQAARKKIDDEFDFGVRMKKVADLYDAVLGFEANVAEGN